MSISLEKIEEKIQPTISKIQQNRYLQALMGSMMATLPVTIMSSFCSLLKILPIPAYQNFISSHGITKYLDVPITFTNNFMAVIIAFALAYAVAKSFDEDGLTAGLLSMVSFFILTPFNTVVNEWGMATYNIPMDWLGAQGIFTAMIVAVISSRIFVAITKKGLIIRMPESVPEFVSKSFSGLIPGLAVLSLFTIISALFSMTPFGSVHAVIYKFLQTPLSGLGSGVGSFIIASIIMQVLWVFGLHGPMIVFSVMSVIWMPAGIEQLAAFSAGKPLPYIANIPFFTTYTSGDLIPLAFMLAFLAKSKRYKTLGKIDIVPAIFGITEPMVFGLPLIMNFTFAIPMIFMNAISLGVAYFATAIGLIPRVGGIGVPMGTPYILSGIMQGSWKIGAFQVVLLVLRFIGWYLFFKMADDMAVKEESGEEVAIA